MQKFVNLALSVTMSVFLTLLIEGVILLQQAGLAVLESTILYTLLMRLALVAGFNPLSIAMPVFPSRDMIRHHSGSALHWIVSVTAGLVFSVLLGTSLIASLTSPGTNYNLNNALTVFVSTPLTAVVFIALTLLFYWLLKRF
jgi:hypothetical protein